LMRASLVWGAGLLAVAIEAAAEPPPLRPLQAFFSESPRFAERLSPDGSKVAFLGPDDRGVIALWVVGLEDPERPLKIKAAEGATVTSYFWVGRHQLLWQEMSPEGAARLHHHDLSSDIARDVAVNDQGIVQLQGVAISRSPSVLVGLSDGPSAFPDLYRVGLADDAPELVCANEHQILSWAWDRDGYPVGGLRWTASGAKELLSLGSHPARVIFSVDPADDLRLLAASPDGSRALVITNHETDLTHLKWIHLTTGVCELIACDPLGRVDLDGVATSVDGELLAALYSDETFRWQPIDPDFARVLASIQPDPAEAYSINILGLDEARRRVLFKRFSGHDPGAVFLLDTATGQAQELWRERPDIGPSDMCETYPIEYEARDQFRVPAFLTLPKDKGRPLPLVVFPHGGPRMKTHAVFDGRVQFFASRGYAVLQPNFRGSRGYGKGFMNAGDCQWGKGVMQNDVTDGVKYLVRKGVASPGHVAIFGGSYGGYAALAGLAFTPDLYAAGISLFGISDLLRHATHHPLEWQAFAGDTVRRLGDPFTVQGRDILADLSPVNQAKEFKAPLLIYHGARDHLIPYDHATSMVEALKGDGKQVSFLLASEEAHGFSNPESEMAVYRAIELFLHEHLGGNVGPDPGVSINSRLRRFSDSGKAATGP